MTYRLSWVCVHKSHEDQKFARRTVVLDSTHPVFRPSHFTPRRSHLQPHRSLRSHAVPRRSYPVYRGLHQLRTNIRRCTDSTADGV